ncbi:hypothetical protein MMC26_000724 [Xylographa opegraphella]|nr:hypothetical protein [Xylographa opegraphella]
MSNTRQTIVLAGAGSVGRYVYEELTSDDRFDVVIISRRKVQWLEDQQATICLSDYSEDSMTSILNRTNASVLVSLINCPTDRYIDIHRTLLQACLNSKRCKRFIPSEWTGNIDDFPLLPAEYAISREPFRKTLKETKGVEWTLFNFGWLADYFLPQSKTYIPAEPETFPIDPNNWRACTRGTGDEPQSWTCARQVGKAVVELLAASHWDPVTYVVGEWSTFNKAVEIMESFHGRPLKKSYRSVKKIEDSITACIHNEDTIGLGLAHLEQWTIAGASACPQERTLEQRDKYFSKLEFSTLEELLKLAETVDLV